MGRSSPDMKERLQDLLRAVTAEYGKKNGIAPAAVPEAELTVTKDPAHGDFASNIAFKLSKLAGRKPAEVAAQLVILIENESKGEPADYFLRKAELAGPGFINFHLRRTSLGQFLIQACEKDRQFGHSDFGKGRKVLVEFVSANPTGPLTIAHGRQAAIGDSIARILEATGHKVQKEYYLNDAGRQMNLLGASLLARYSEALGKPEPLPEDGYQGAYLKDLAKDLIGIEKDTLLKLPKEEALDRCRKFAGDTIMDGIREDLESIRVSFDSYFNETSLYEKGDVEKVISILKDRGMIFEQDGAIWFRSTDFGDDKDRVIKKSTGEYTYLAPDIAYHHLKFQRGFQRLVNLLGPDHHGYIPRLKAACQALGHDPEGLNVLIVQLTTLYRKGQPVRMSTRAGEFVTLKELVNEVGCDATRCFFVMRKFESHLDFDLDLAKEKSQENPVFYLQYAHARISSLLNFSGRPVNASAKLERLVSQEEADVMKIVGEFSDALIRASEALEPYRLADYLREVAASFHKFYSQHRIVTDDHELTDARLLLADAVRIVLRNGLDLLGISHPESM